jgi:hypothetical protein
LIDPRHVIKTAADTPDRPATRQAAQRHVNRAPACNSRKSFAENAFPSPRRLIIASI